jgi:hypothetical protein
MLYFQVGNAVIDDCYFANNTGVTGACLQFLAGNTSLRSVGVIIKVAHHQNH